jgi:hypothetical protein
MPGHTCMLMISSGLDLMARTVASIFSWPMLIVAFIASWLAHMAALILTFTSSWPALWWPAWWPSLFLGWPADNLTSGPFPQSNNLVQQSTTSNTSCHVIMTKHGVQIGNLIYGTLNCLIYK